MNINIKIKYFVQNKTFDFILAVIVNSSFLSLRKQYFFLSVKLSAKYTK